MRKYAAILGATLLLASAGWWIYELRYRVQPLPPLNYRLPVTLVENGRIVSRVPGSRLLGELARYEDELFAYLMFDFLRSQPAFAGTPVLITYVRNGGRIQYVLKAVPVDDTIAGIPALYRLASGFPFLTPVWEVAGDRAFREQQDQTGTFVRAYNYPAYRKLELMSRRTAVAYARRFIRFKSSTDPRIRRQIEPIPHALNAEEAERLAEDIVTVARFYNLPLDFFLGIGAMENNYMNVRGDLGRAIWKKRAAKDDVVLRRSKGRVLVLNEAAGVWQITLQTLRDVHALYLRDKERDYFKLPEHLRPPRDLSPDGLDHRILTTYAGLLFRDLLDRFDGDTAKAVGAYNGGPGNPNAKYEAGVRRVAGYARRMMERAAMLRGQRIVDRRTLRASP